MDVDDDILLVDFILLVAWLHAPLGEEERLQEYRFLSGCSDKSDVSSALRTFMRAAS